jgi:hypothetical protein
MYCPICSLELVKYGFTSSGKQRYKCPNCGYVKVLANPKVDPEVARLEAWIRRLERRIEDLESQEPEVNPNAVGKNAYSR